jgi:hypothetical protein
MTQPTCPFCGAEWSHAMLASFDAMSHPSGCSCCVDPSAAPRTWKAVALDDIACTACKKTLYSKPQVRSS